jgi:hypothetical protein
MYLSFSRSATHCFYRFKILFNRISELGEARGSACGRFHSCRAYVDVNKVTEVEMKLSLVVRMLLVLLVAIPAYASEKVDEKRLDEIAQRGSQIMPFDLEKTTHVFSRTPNGGLQQVIVKDKSDIEQIELIRAHLSEILRDFKRGDFSKPARIHGESMPGLAELKSAKPGEIKTEYVELPDGAQISYSSNSPKLINAIHRWFDAQLHDHARHAVPGHEHHPMHH